jgi:CTP-dependent riboflavin kinase
MPNKNEFISNLDLRNKINISTGSIVDEKEYRSNLLLKAIELDILTEEEINANVPNNFNVIKSYLNSRLTDTEAQQIIKKLVYNATKAYVIGTRVLSGWMIENKLKLEDENYFKNTLQNSLFLRDAFRGIKVKGEIHNSLEESKIFNSSLEYYPKIEEIINLCGVKL